MQKARQSEFGRTRAAADCRVCFVNNNGTARTRQCDRRSKTIWSRANDNRIISIWHELPVAVILEATRASCELKPLQVVYHAQTRRSQDERGVTSESHASQKQMTTSLQQGIAQTHRCASRDRVNSRASRFASRWRCRQQLRLQNDPRRGLALDLRCQIQPRPANR